MATNPEEQSQGTRRERQRGLQLPEVLGRPRPREGVGGHIDSWAKSALAGQNQELRERSPKSRAVATFLKGHSVQLHDKRACNRHRSLKEGTNTPEGGLQCKLYLVLTSWPTHGGAELKE